MKKDFTDITPLELYILQHMTICNENRTIGQVRKVFRCSTKDVRAAVDNIVDSRWLYMPREDIPLPPEDGMGASAPAPRGESFMEKRLRERRCKLYDDFLSGVRPAKLASKYGLSVWVVYKDLRVMSKEHEASLARIRASTNQERRF